MDASDAAEYVQELAGENANIIFGAMYDDSRSDEATITVIATGLHNVGGSSSKLKARLEGQQKVGSILPSGDVVSRSAIDPERRTASPRPAGRPAGGTMPTLDQPRTPSSKVKPDRLITIRKNRQEPRGAPACSFYRKFSGKPLRKPTSSEFNIFLAARTALLLTVTVQTGTGVY